MTPTEGNPLASDKKIGVKQLSARLENVHPGAKLDLDSPNRLELLLALMLFSLRSWRSRLVKSLLIPVM